MILFNPKTATYDHLDPASRQIMKKTIAYFENRGKKQLKADFHQRVWYQDFLDFLKENQIFSPCSPRKNMP
jgi:acyl-CoA dehydrogenase